MRKSHFELAPALYLALVLFTEYESSEIFLIPSTTWFDPVDPFVSRNYGTEMKSAPEWGLKLTKDGRRGLDRFRFEIMAPRLRGSG